MCKKCLRIGVLPFLLAGCGSYATDRSDRSGGSTAAAAAPSGAQGGPAADDCADPASLADALKVVDDPGAGRALATTNPICFAWRAFVALSWPAVPSLRGVPAADKPFGAPGPVVWGTWKSVTPVAPPDAPPSTSGSSEVYVARNSQPTPWPAGDPAARPVLDGVQIDGRALEDPNGNDVVSEVRMNRSAYEYILSRALYSLAGQTALLRTKSAVRFPPAAMEVKASWRVLGPNDDASRYLTKPIVYVDYGKPARVVTAGLTGLHITSRVLDDWFWATFEHVDNPTTTGIDLLLPIAAAVRESNARMQRQVAGTRWQYFQLNGVQTAYTGADGQPTLLANSQIETHFQKSSSCITCHSLSSIEPAASPRLDFWIGAHSQGYVGASPFTRLSDGVSLDFVWSLRRAQ